MNIEILRELCGMAAPPSREGAVRGFVMNALKGCVDEIGIDSLGNVVAHKAGGGPKAMFVAHMDQPGFIVNYIDAVGFLRFSAIGEMDPWQAANQPVVFENGMLGAIASEKPYDGKLQAASLYMDIGCRSREEAEKHVSIGDMCVFAGGAVVDGHKIISPGLGRAAAFALIEAAKASACPQNDTYFVFSAQREMDSLGARTSIWGIKPDFVVSFDLTPSYDAPGHEDRQLPAKLGGGAAIKLKDSSVICAPKAIHYIEETAKANGIKYQFEIAESYASEAGAMHAAVGGAPTGGVSIPARGLGSALPMCLLSDIEDCAMLASALACASFAGL